MHTSLRAALAVATLAAAVLASPAALAQQAASEVYEWKDANGNMQYSQTPPAKGAYRQRAINQAGSAVASSAPVASAAEVSPQCSTARDNIVALQGAGDVQQAANADGTPGRTLTPAERLGQMELAQAAVKAYCPS